MLAAWAQLSFCFGIIRCDILVKVASKKLACEKKECEEDKKDGEEKKEKEEASQGRPHRLFKHAPAKCDGE